MGDRLRWVLDPSQGYSAVEVAAVQGSGANLVWTGAGPSERLTGVLFYDWFASWRTSAAAAVEVLASGPGVVRLRTQWSADPQGADASMTGTTTWTFHADGRVHRDERVVLEDERSGWLVAYHTVPIERVGQLVWHDGTQVRTASAVTALGGADFALAVQGDAQTRWVCSQGGAGQDVVLLAVHAAAPESAGLRATWNGQAGGGDTHSLHLQFDWLRSGPPSATGWSASLLTWVGAGDCATAAAYADAHRTPPPVTLLAGAWAPSEGDLDADGYDEGGGFVAVTPGDGGRAELRFDGPSAPSWTLFVVTASVGAPSPSVGGEALVEGEHFVAAHAAGGWFLHLRRPMGIGETLTVETQ